MQAAIYSTKDFEEAGLSEAAKQQGISLKFIDKALGLETVTRSAGCEVVSVFAGDDASAAVLEKLFEQGVRHIAVRAAGYDNVALRMARILGITVANVPAYSPYAIAEHAIALMLGLNRQLIMANQQVHDYNFTVGNLIGFDLHDKTVGIIGTGIIGSITARILHGFGCKLLGYDVVKNQDLEKEFGLQYTDMDTLCAQSDIITIHTCLTPQTQYLINEATINKMKKGVMLINTSRGAVINTEQVIEGLVRGIIGSFGTDVYEHEKGVFFYDRSGDRPNDPLLKRLLEMPQVLVTPHQAFATREALKNIADTTCESIASWQDGKKSKYEL